jgi:hypothetical protein
VLDVAGGKVRAQDCHDACNGWRLAGGQRPYGLRLVQFAPPFPHLGGGNYVVSRHCATEKGPGACCNRFVAWAVHSPPMLLLTIVRCAIRRRHTYRAHHHTTPG